MRLMVLILLTGWAMGQTRLEGTLINGSGSDPATADMVQLIKLEQGMQVIGSADKVKDVFSLNLDGAMPDGRYLLQAVKDGVIYTLAVQTANDKLELTVYDTVDQAEIKSHIGSLALYAYDQVIDIGAFYNLDNVSDPAVTLNRTDGTYTFTTIPGSQGLEASTRRGQMPLRQQLKKEDGQATLTYPLRPGRTQLMVRSRHAYNPAHENTYRIALPPNQDGMHVLVLPLTLEVTGEGLTFAKDDPKEGVRLYEFMPNEGQTELVLKITGQGDPEPRDDKAGTSNAGQQTKEQAHGQAKIDNTPNQLHPYRWWIICGVISLLGGLVLLSVRR